MMILARVAALLAIAASAHAQGVLELKGHRLGKTTEAELVTRYASIQCHDQDSGPADRICRVMGRSAPELATLAERPVLRWEFSFRDSRLGAIEASLPGATMPEIIEALAAKFGKPTRSGAWIRGDEVLTVDRISLLDTVIVKIESRKFAATPTARSKIEKRAKDL